MPLYEMRKFVAPELIFGVGARRRIGLYVQNLQAQHVLVVTDNGIIHAGWLDGLLTDLDRCNLQSVVFSAITPNPKDHEVIAGSTLYHDKSCDVIVAIGGGSVIDCAKGIAILSANGGAPIDFEGVDQIPHPGPPLLCIPTTAGTAAEISQFAIINNTAECSKITIISKGVVPDVALIDPETALTMTSYLRACTGFEALAHAIEAYVSTAHSPIVDIHALAAIELIRDNLPMVTTEPENLAACENMMLACLHAGLAFSNAGLGITHAMAHSLGGYLDLPHGESSALLLEHVMRFNYGAAEDRYQRIGQALGVALEGIPAQQQVQSLAETVHTLRKRCGIGGGLASRGVSCDTIDTLAQSTLDNVCILTNPRHTDLPDIKALYHEAL